MYYVYVASLNDCINNVSSKAFELLANSSKAYVYKKIQKKDQYRTAIAEILLKMIFINELNLRGIYFDRTRGGVLFSKNWKNYFFSISHSENYIIVIVSNFKVGIDIQFMNKNMIKIADRFFYPEEIEYVYRIEEKIEEHFYEVWTKKESYYKYMNHKLHSNFLSINTMQDVGRTMEKFNTIIVKDNYMLTICTTEVITDLKNKICFISSFEINNFIEIYEKKYNR
ncbi:4'-phosphopantetheinyl transferase family protein [Fusobacterium sp. CM21]|uniref:4'-phosphopantetheinyl transferase family protein n=1 Tax=Fusobacterium nucleatum TaxID=851 RepID=UPI0003E2C74C|nr:4'-phosphopantetheinyl transferase superfamily protein [Fusobacterium nucleatum]ETT13588.1 4'-phosphopantetheinyl transferase family protein [Fusobacterium sp. CM21]OHU82024.1 hypothetical protein BKN39_06760 [Fusobacterium nucleatum]